jgi:hypothetical protein
MNRLDVIQLTTCHLSKPVTVSVRVVSHISLGLAWRCARGDPWRTDEIGDLCESRLAEAKVSHNPSLKRVMTEDPLEAGKRMNSPVRGKNCRHIDVSGLLVPAKMNMADASSPHKCFDFYSYMGSQRQPEPDWKCPICGYVQRRDSQCCFKKFV